MFHLAGMAYLSMVDFSRYDLDAPLPEITTNASRASFAAYHRTPEGWIPATGDLAPA